MRKTKMEMRKILMERWRKKGIIGDKKPKKPWFFKYITDGMIQNVQTRRSSPTKQILLYCI